MYYSPKEADENHEFAQSAAYGGVIHISNVKDSGRHDYTCLGCTKPMQAILRKIYGAKLYFRHDVQDVPSAQRCTFSNEQYRRKIALDTLQLQKQLRLPPLYLLPPKGTDGLAIKLQDSQVHQFEDVRRQQQIFETVDGAVNFGPTADGELLMTADAVCFDEDNIPVLLVLISDGKRKKMDTELMAVLARLRINTVVITPAKASPEEIHQAVISGKNTKWLYHDDERQFDYASLSAGITETIPASDIDQGLLYEETFDCRKAEINNFIRTINKFLGAEPYRAAKEQNRRIIGETEFAIRRAEERWDEYHERYRTASESVHQGEIDGIDERRRELGTAKTEFSGNYQDLDERYRRKKRELEEAARILESTIRAAELAQVGGGRSIAARRSELEREHENARRRMDDLFERELRSVDSQRTGVERDAASERTAIERLRDLVSKEPGRLKRLLQEKANEFDQLEANETTAIRQLQTNGEELPERFATEESQLREEFEELRRRTAAAAENRTASGDNGLSRRLKALMDARGSFVAIQDAQSDHRKHRAAKEFLESAAGEAWLCQH